MCEVVPSSSGVSERMRRQSRRDTSPEVLLRKSLHASGLRFRVSYPVPSCPRRSIDIAFTRVRVAVFVDGCFWHGCPQHGTWPRANADWWRAKLQLNILRDRNTDDLLINEGWTVLRVWEHECSRDAAGRVAQVVASRRQLL
jgi:DNA mismatch endonuclease, patch repair protein